MPRLLDSSCPPRRPASFPWRRCDPPLRSSVAQASSWSATCADHRCPELPEEITTGLGQRCSGPPWSGTPRPRPPRLSWRDRARRTGLVSPRGIFDPLPRSPHMWPEPTRTLLSSVVARHLSVASYLVRAFPYLPRTGSSRAVANVRWLEEKSISGVGPPDALRTFGDPCPAAHHHRLRLRSLFRRGPACQITLVDREGDHLGEGVGSAGE